MKKTRLMSMLCAIAMALTLVLPVSALAENAQNSTIISVACTEIEAVYASYYTISNVAGQIINEEIFETGNIAYTVAIDFEKTLLAKTAEDLPYIQGLLAAEATLNSPQEQARAMSYIDLRKNDLEANYIGVAQPTYVEVVVTVPAAVRYRMPNIIVNDKLDIQVLGTFGQVPLNNLLPRSDADMHQSGIDAIAEIVRGSEVNLPMATAASNDAKAYNRIAARDYARNWSCTNGSLTEHKTCHNPDYTFYDRVDCANFVSQCLAAGGLATNETWKKDTSTWIGVSKLRTYVVNNSLFFHSTDELKAFAGSIINWTGTGDSHVGLVDQNDTVTMTFCAHTRCRKSCAWAGESVDFYIPVWDSYANQETPRT